MHETIQALIELAGQPALIVAAILATAVTVVFAYVIVKVMRLPAETVKIAAEMAEITTKHLREQLDMERADHKQERGEDQERIKKLETEVDRLKLAQEQTDKTLADRTSSLNTTERLLAAAQNEIDELKKELAELQKANKEKATALKEAGDRLKRMEDELNLVKSDRAQVARERDDLRSRLETMKGEIEQLRERLNKAQVPDTGPLEEKKVA